MLLWNCLLTPQVSARQVQTVVYLEIKRSIRKRLCIVLLNSSVLQYNGPNCIPHFVHFFLHQLTLFIFSDSGIFTRSRVISSKIFMAGNHLGSQPSYAYTAYLYNILYSELLVRDDVFELLVKQRILLAFVCCKCNDPPGRWRLKAGNTCDLTHTHVWD